MNYTGRYGMEFNPFIKNSKEILVETSDYKEVTFRLNYLLNIRGFGVLTGQPGLGKTTLLRNWSHALNQSAYKIIYISMSTLTVLEFYRQLASQMGIDPYFRKIDNFKAIQDVVIRYEKEKKIIPVIILDEAQYLKHATLNDLKIIFNFEMDSQDKAVILLAGLPQLNNILSLNSHEPLRQRITMNYELQPLDKEEASRYIEEKMKAAGCLQKVFDSNAMEAILNAGGGIPRMINKICNACLMTGNSRNENIISADTVMDTVNDLQLI